MTRLLPFFLLASLHAGDSTTPGEVTSPFPTITNLAVEWQIEGDDDLDAVCEIKFRPAGAAEWRSGMPLRRVPAGSSRKTDPIISWTNRLSGSVFDLRAGTEYEIALTLHDPDGGDATRIVKASTRPEPIAAKDAVIRNGTRADLNSVKPGEVLLLADGDYGEVRFNRDGEPGKPVVYRSTSGKAIFREAGLTDRKWVYLEGVTVNGPVRLNNTEHCVVRRCMITSQYGIKAYKPGMRNACIEDNVITGIRKWDPSIMGAGGDNEGEGIEFTGSGNVIRHNRVSGFRDCISHMEDGGAVSQACNDILNNDISAGLDDGIEADFAHHNCRVMRNRLTNCFVGISSQPGLGGPNYFIRNVLFNITYGAFKLHRFSVGDVILHNTVVKAGDGFGNYTGEAFDHALIQNNLFIGGKPPEGVQYGGYSPGRGRAADVQNFGEHCVIDFNAYATHDLAFEGKLRSWTFKRLPGTEFESHGVQVTLAVLAQPVFPEDPAQFYEPPDLRLKLKSAAEGIARAFPNVNDTFSGTAPDLGAHEAGMNAPVYGPRETTFPPDGESK
ncbi:MAG: right-handed parallel beta-helix repeat-containing protein [Verrucomicrobia bacterium]|nr:right-handed parallel beta-helix repeat-containing protein [Verrucomicrobiota bacterium]